MAHKRASILLWALAALLLSTIVASCNLAPAPEKVELPKPEMPVTKLRTVEPPAGWPETIPLYPDAELDDVTLTESGRVITLTTKDSAAQIFAWYYDELEKRAWTMRGPTLDVAQNIAIIEGELDNVKMYLEARSVENEDGKPGGLAIKITSGF